MKRLILFFLPILIVVCAVLIGYGIWNVRREENRLLDELQRKARAVAESLEVSAQYVLAQRDVPAAQRLVERFETRKNFQGCVLYDEAGKIFAITRRIAFLQEQFSPAMPLPESVESGAATSLERYQEYVLYRYRLPVSDAAGRRLGMVEVVYDTSYVFFRLAQLWERIGMPVIVLVILLFCVSVLMQWRLFIFPLRQLTDWFRRFHRGETSAFSSIKGADEMRALAGEVEQVALSLRVARRAVADTASARLENTELWTEKKLRDIVVAKLGDHGFFAVSNREPYMHIVNQQTNRPVCVRPASGVVTALDPILRACGGMWLAHGSGSADRAFVNAKDKVGVPPEDIRYVLKRVWLSKAEEQGYYYGFANEGLWPLCHITHTRPLFRSADWQMYQKVNQRFADALLEELPQDGHAFVFIQDYHFTLLPRMIKARRPDVTVALFWHIPWPNPEVFAICPYQQEILDGMLGCDLIGFHLQFHCNNFLETANRFLESRIDTEKFSVHCAGHETLVRPFPISVAVAGSERGQPAVSGGVRRLREEFSLEGKIVAVGVDRIDYTKGLNERMLAVDRLLTRYPEYRGKFVLLQLAAPSRTHIKRYHDLLGELDELVEKINWNYSDGTWKPIIYLKHHFSQDEILPYYQVGDICIVSSLHDGMNLVAKEYVTAKDDLNGMLVLSKFTGAARELTDAVQINPYSIEEFAQGVHQAIVMPVEEKQRRMERMRALVKENNIFRWAGTIFNELMALKRDA
ncbi:MAG: trehalose-6-phosphate synthase [Candidatus Omnitrophica bacterium]|nr:trehalose-6-phosphate synthase [Candidatus Omnitrophota bacterium]